MLVCAKIVKLVKWERLVLREKNTSQKVSWKLCILTYVDPLEQKFIVEEKNFILFVDDYSRMMTVMYLKEKSEAFEKFKWYLERVEKETRKRLKSLRSNRGGEFMFNEFNNFQIGRGIKR